jgi:pseudouridine kinase
MSEWVPQVVVVGLACLDIKGHVFEKINPGTSSSGEVRIAVGGVGRNVAENLARLGTHTALLAVVGRDPFGHQVVKHTSSAGVDVAQVLFARDQRTASYLALLDDEGNLAAAVDDTAIIQELTPRYVYDRRRMFRRARMVVVDANTPVDTAETVIRLAQKYGARLCLDPVSLELAPRYRGYLEHFHLLAAGALEAAALTGKPITTRRNAADAARHLVGAGVEVVIINLGREGVVYATTEYNGYVPAVRCEVVDQTGASDALTAAVIYGLVNGIPLDEAVWLGVSAAALTLQSMETVRSDLSLDLVYQQLVS